MGDRGLARFADQQATIGTELHIGRWGCILDGGVQAGIDGESDGQNQGDESHAEQDQVDDPGPAAAAAWLGQLLRWRLGSLDRFLRLVWLVFTNDVFHENLLSLLIFIHESRDQSAELLISCQTITHELRLISRERNCRIDLGAGDRIVHRVRMRQPLQGKGGIALRHQEEDRPGDTCRARTDLQGQGRRAGNGCARHLRRLQAQVVRRKANAHVLRGGVIHPQREREIAHARCRLDTVGTHTQGRTEQRPVQSSIADGGVGRDGPELVGAQIRPRLQRNVHLVVGGRAHPQDELAQVRDGSRHREIEPVGAAGRRVRTGRSERVADRCERAVGQEQVGHIAVDKVCRGAGMIGFVQRETHAPWGRGIIRKARRLLDRGEGDLVAGVSERQVDLLGGGRAGCGASSGDTRTSARRAWLPGRARSMLIAVRGM